jgi:uncharacterized membrane protein
MGNSIGTLIVIWGIAIFFGLCVLAVWRSFRSRLTDDDSTYECPEGDLRNFRK